jgi:hypothetical protein
MIPHFLTSSLSLVWSSAGSSIVIMFSCRGVTSSHPLSSPALLTHACMILIMENCLFIGNTHRGVTHQQQTLVMLCSSTKQQLPIKPVQACLVLLQRRSHPYMFCSCSSTHMITNMTLYCYYNPGPSFETRVV